MDIIGFRSAYSCASNNCEAAGHVLLLAPSLLAARPSHHGLPSNALLAAANPAQAPTASAAAADT